ncbi:MAG: hypothetical protein LBQ24_00400 [Candidatus Peribacteria bacterium]|jgi:hypothetical protein|nr:hypothetical protein [Candidatus Peribacteria bacterium]
MFNISTSSKTDVQIFHTSLVLNPADCKAKFRTVDIVDFHFVPVIPITFQG